MTENRRTTQFETQKDLEITALELSILVGTFDPGFISRVNVVIYYPDFTDEKRGQIWDIFFNKLERERENIKFTQRTVDYAKESKEIQSLDWNGSEIRNGMYTLVTPLVFIY